MYYCVWDNCKQQKLCKRFTVIALLCTLNRCGGNSLTMTLAVHDYLEAKTRKGEIVKSKV